MAILFSTERLIVRKFTADDHTDLAEILTDPVVTYFEPYQTFTKEACVQEAINFSKSNEFFAVVFEEKVIGKIYFSDRKYGTFEIGYTFNRAKVLHLKALKLCFIMRLKNLEFVVLLLR